MLNCYVKNGGRNPVSFGSKASDWRINGTIIHSHFGAGSIVKYKYFGNKINEIYLNTTEKRIIKGIKSQDDVLYTYAALINGYRYIRCKDYSISKYINNNKLSKPFSENYNKKYSLNSKSYHAEIRKYIKEKYNLTLEEIIKKHLYK